MYDVPVSFSIYMDQVTLLIDVPIGVAEKSPWPDLLKKSQWFCGYNFGSQFNAHRLKTLEPSSVAGSHFHYSDVIMSAMV